MKAVALYEHGGPEVLTYGDLPDPTIGPGDVLIRLKASALNRMDLFAREGWKGLKLDFPHILGADGAGKVEAVGAEVEDVRSGDAVVANPGLNCGACAACRRGEDSLCETYGILGEHRNGTYAELLSLPARNVLPMPKGVSFPEAAAVPLVFMTAWRMLVERARVQEGETVLIMGAGGGVASAAIQIAKLQGATVYATTSTEEKLRKAREIGADAAFNYREEPYGKAVWEATGKRGVDVVVDCVGAATWPDSIRALAKDGRLVTCGATTGPRGETDLRYVFWRQLQILGSTMGTRAGLVRVLKHVEEGRLRPLVHAEFPLAEAPKAHQTMADGVQFGKLVLRP